jgi:glucokinase
VLVGDLGGTNIRLELFKGRESQAKWHKLTKDSLVLIDDIEFAIEEMVPKGT